MNAKEFLRPTLFKSALFFLLSVLFIYFALGQHQFASKMTIVSLIPFIALAQGIGRSLGRSAERIQKAAEIFSSKNIIFIVSYFLTIFIFCAFGAFFAFNCLFYPIYYSCNSYLEAAFDFSFLFVIYFLCCVPSWISAKSNTFHKQVVY